MPKLIDLTGVRFGRLVIIKRDATKNKRTHWLCECDCGTIKSIGAQNLKHPNPKCRVSSCGCYQREQARRFATIHGQSQSVEMKMFWGAKKRAKEKDLAFNIEPSDILIPKTCPYLGIPIFVNGKKQTPNSPALDRVDSSKGYVKGNIQVLSNRANTMKHDAAFEEFEIMYRNWKTQR